MDGEHLVQQQDQQHRPRPPEINQVAPNHQAPPPPPRCPRCDSTNTKFCYYNNYSLSQPRYLCKACRRYWTQGGTLRTVPIGGGCRKTKRHRLPSSSSSPLSNGFIPTPQGSSTAAVWSQNVVSRQPSRPAPPMVRSMGGSDLYSTGSYLPSLAAMQSLPVGGVNHEAAVMGSGGGGGRFGSNTALLQEMSSFPLLKSPALPRQQFTPPTRFFPPHQSLVQPGRFSSWTQNVLNAGAMIRP